MLSIRRSELLDPLDWESNMFPLYNYRLFFSFPVFFLAILSPASIAWLRNNSKMYFILTNSLSAKEKGKSRIHSHSRAYFSLLDSCLLSLIIHSVQKQMFVKHTKKASQWETLSQQLQPVHIQLFTSFHAVTIFFPLTVKWSQKIIF